jgi:hypothetical protein
MDLLFVGDYPWPERQGIRSCGHPVIASGGFVADSVYDTKGEGNRQSPDLKGFKNL